MFKFFYSLNLRAIFYLCARMRARAGARPYASVFQIFLRSETEGKYLGARI
jgi:hypothetical protein